LTGRRAADGGVHDVVRRGFQRAQGAAEVGRPHPAPTEARQQRGEEKLVVDMAFALEVAVAGT
jgi:hypothetical protein